MGSGSSVESKHSGNVSNLDAIVRDYMQERLSAIVSRETKHINGATNTSTSIYGRKGNASENSLISTRIPADGSKKSLRSLKSLKSMAMKSYSKQENMYIPHERILSASVSHFSKLHASSKNVNGATLTTVGSAGSISSGFNSKPGSNAGSYRKTPTNSDGNLQYAIDGSDSVVAPTTVDRNGNSGPANAIPKKGIKPNLRINIQDDADWIQVSDDEGGDDDATIKSKTPRNTLSIIPHAQQSYLFTQSGTIFVDGFKEGIGKDGIHAEETSASKLSLHDRIVFMAKLGSGASGIVYKALDLWEMQLVAVKMIPMFDRAKRRQCVKEVSILFSILRAKNSTEGKLRYSSPDKPFDKRPHGYVVDFYDAFSNIDEGGVAIMMEYMDGGSLQDIVNDGGCDDETTLANIALQGLEGLAYLHDCAQLHRDLKPGNFLISKHGDCKIADLGILRQMEAADHSSVPAVGSVEEGESIPRAQTFVGTATYMSPERIDGRDYSYPSDIWSFGLSLLTVALGRLPIDTQGGYWTILHSIRDDKPPSVPDDGRFSDEFKDFISCMLVRKPEERKSAIQLLAHPFLTKACAEDAEVDNDFAENLGISELKAIVSAVTQHLERRQVEQSRAPVNLQEGSECQEVPLETILGNLANYTYAEALDKIFFQGRDLQSLAQQLNLSTDKLCLELKKLIAEIGDSNVGKPLPPVQSSFSEAYISTPKAKHGKSRHL